MEGNLLNTDQLMEVEVEEVEIEIFARRGEQPPHAKRYVIRVDKEKFVVHTHTITGAQILALAGKTPEKYKLYQHKRGHQPIPVGADETVDLRQHGIERFTTMARDTTEGRGVALELRREFQLTAAEEDYLDGLSLPWETIKDGQTLWLVIHDWRVSNGYREERASLALLIPPQYPDSQIDMVYFKPALARADGKAINTLSVQRICNESWQRWSRHRTTQNPWRPGIDDVASHLALVDEWLRREIGG